MSSSRTTNTFTLRRFATFLAAIAALVMSSGVAMMVAAGPAHAAVNKIGVCHATSSDTNPYNFILVDDDSTKLEAHLAHKNTPNKTWNNAGTFEGVQHAAGAAKPDIIGANVTAADCDGDLEVPPTEATADVDFIDPTCANQNLADYEAVGSNVTFEITDGSKTPGSHIEVTATANEGSEFNDESTTMVFKHDYPEAVDLEAPPCVPAGPQIATASVDFVDPTCANQNEASFQGTGEDATFAVTDGSQTPGSAIEVTATANEGFTFDGESTTKVFTHTFGDAVDLNAVPCVDVAGPIATPDEVATPTVVHSGLVTPDSGGNQGLAVLVTGMIMMVLAGGLGLVRPTRK